MLSNTKRKFDLILLQILKEELTLILHRLFPKTEENTSNSFYKANITLTPKSDKDITIDQYLGIQTQNSSIKYSHTKTSKILF